MAYHCLRFVTLSLVLLSVSDPIEAKLYGISTNNRSTAASVIANSINDKLPGILKMGNKIMLMVAIDVNGKTGKDNFDLIKSTIIEGINGVSSSYFSALEGGGEIMTYVMGYDSETQIVVQDDFYSNSRSEFITEIQQISIIGDGPPPSCFHCHNSTVYSEIDEMMNVPGYDPIVLVGSNILMMTNAPIADESYFSSIAKEHAESYAVYATRLGKATTPDDPTYYTSAISVSAAKQGTDMTDLAQSTRDNENAIRLMRVYYSQYITREKRSHLQGFLG